MKEQQKRYIKKSEASDNININRNNYERSS